MKPSEKLFLERKKYMRLGVHVMGSTRNPQGRGRTLHPRGPLVAPLMYFFRLYILIYPGNIRTGGETLFPPPQLSVPVRSHLGAFFGAPPEGESITEDFYINTIASPIKGE